MKEIFLTTLTYKNSANVLDIVALFLKQWTYETAYRFAQGYQLGLSMFASVHPREIVMLTTSPNVQPFYDLIPELLAYASSVETSYLYYDDLTSTASASPSISVPYIVPVATYPSYIQN